MIDDDEAVRESLEALLTVAGCIVDTFASAEAYLTRLDLGTFHGDCAILDAHMPGMNGLELLRVLVDRSYLLPVLLLTASHDEHVRNQALELGAVDCLTKPVPEDVLLKAIESAARLMTPRH